MYFTPIRFGILSCKDQSNCGLYKWIVFMNICFGFKVRPSLFCYRFDLIGPCWSEVSIPVLDFYLALGENIVCGFLNRKVFGNFMVVKVILLVYGIN